MDRYCSPLPKLFIVLFLWFYCYVLAYDVLAGWLGRAFSELKVHDWRLTLSSTRSLSTKKWMGILWQHWGDKGGEESNRPPHLTKWIAQDKFSIEQARTIRIRD